MMPSEYEKVAAILGKEWRDWFIHATCNSPKENCSDVDVYSGLAWDEAHREFKFSIDYFPEFQDVFAETFYS